MRAKVKVEAFITNAPIASHSAASASVLPLTCSSVEPSRLASEDAAASLAPSSPSRRRPARGRIAPDWITWVVATAMGTVRAVVMPRVEAAAFTAEASGCRTAFCRASADIVSESVGRRQFTRAIAAPLIVDVSFVSRATKQAPRRPRRSAACGAASGAERLQRTCCSHARSSSRQRAGPPAGLSLPPDVAIDGLGAGARGLPQAVGSIGLDLRLDGAQALHLASADTSSTRLSAQSRAASVHLTHDLASTDACKLILKFLGQRRVA